MYLYVMKPHAHNIMLAIAKYRDAHKIMARKEKKEEKCTFEYRRKGWPKVTKAKIGEIKHT